MTLDSGTRLGPYEIVAALGAGGMGEVYRARDTRLEREVAVKVLPAHTSSPQAFERFEREAKAIAALSHPGICAIYDVGTSPVPFLVMELLDGETLQQRLARGPLDVGGLVDTALALADALASAHGKEIVHRDLKPGNIVLTPRGPRILDFGLARIGNAVSPEVAATVSAHGPITEAGVAVGTAAYMSPEQLRGEPLDARTDLFSLGLVLYEMATGRRAFQGSTSVVTSAAILHHEPTAPRELRPDLPVRLERAIVTLLEKDREVRTQTAAELRAELTRMKRELTASRAPEPAASSDIAGSGASNRVGVDTVALSPDSSDAQLIAGVLRRHRRRVAEFTAVLLLAVGGAAYYFTRTSPDATAVDPAPVSIGDLQLEQLTTSGTANGPAISPDGKYVAYIDVSIGGDSLRVRQVATGSNVEILPPEPGVRLAGLTVTPDGEFVTYLKLRQAPPAEVWQVPYLGGSPQRLLQGVGGRVGYSADGTRMAYVRAASANHTELVVAAIDGSNPKVLAQRRAPDVFLSTSTTGLLMAIGPAWSADGKTLAVLGYSMGGTGKDTGQGVFVDVQTGSQRAVNAGPPLIGNAVAWLDNQWLVISMLQRSSEPMQLWLLSHVTGEFRRLSNDLSQYTAVSLTATRDALVTGRSESFFGIWTSDVSSERWTQVVPDTPMKGPIGFGIAWMGDDLAYVASTSSGFALMRRNAAGKTEVVARSAGDPSVSLDGSTIAYFDYDSGELFKADASGAGRVRLSSGFGPRSRITPDGSSVAKVVIEAGALKLRLYSLDGTASVRDVNAERVANGPAEVSPDGRLIAYSAVDDQQRALIAVCVLSDCSARRTLPPLLRWHWTPDGRGFAYVERGKQSDIWVQPLDGSGPRQLTHFAGDGRIVADFGWSADGRRLAVARSTTGNNIVMLRGLRRSR